MSANASRPGRPRDAMFVDVLDGLASSPRTLSPKYFYDKVGSLLFDRITELPEYYLTRAETSLLRTHARALCELMGPRAALVELGSGSSIKTRIVLDHATELDRYVPVDISSEHLLDTAAGLRVAYPRLTVAPIVADYSKALPPMDAARSQTGGRNVVFFPGSSIGNFEPEEAVSFLRRVAPLAGATGLVIIGVDIPKDAAVLERAYDDASGVTAQFNKNVLSRINEELGADFDLDGFAHHAPWQPGPSRIEMRLVSTRSQSVALDGHRFAFDAGEIIVTEHCYKWSPERFIDLAARAGLRSQAVLFDPAGQVSMHVLAAA